MTLTETPPTLSAVVVLPRSPAHPSCRPAPPTTTRTTDRLAGLDGLRALAVLAVLAFHFGVSWLPGGYLGVDLFYVLSGFLITLLLVGEHSSRGRIALGRFWARRARRLLPCLFLVVLAAAAYVRFVAPPGAYPGFRSDALSALFYFSNWHQIAANANYFVATGPPSPLTHTWSLAIEEQFYLLWPLVVLGVLRLCGRSRPATGVTVLGSLSLAGALASAAEMALRYGPSADTTRLYFGTDTHAQPLLVGAFVACLLVRIRMRSPGPSRSRIPAAVTEGLRAVLVVGGAAALSILAILMVRLPGSDGGAYQGGFLLAAACCAVIIVAAVTMPTGPFARLLSARPLVWLGTVSYGIYLWHYPLGLYLSPTRTGLTGPALFVARFGATVALAATSYYLVERPVMEGRFWRGARAFLPAGAAIAGTTALALVATAAAPVAATPVRRNSPSLAIRATSASGTLTAPITPPHEVLVLGDSTALVLSYALAATAPASTSVVDGGLFGCGLAIATRATAAFSSAGLPMVDACNASTAPAQQWPAIDAQKVAATGPGDLVVFLAGHWETQEILLDGHWTNLDSASFRAYELHQLQELASLAVSRGAHLELFTMACMDGGFAQGDPPGPTDSARRRDYYNAMLRQVAAEDPAQVSVVDFGSLVCPTGTFTQYLNGVQVRTADGVHTPAYAPDNPFAGNATRAVADAFYSWLGPRLWPMMLDHLAAPSSSGVPAPATSLPAVHATAPSPAG